MNERTVAERRHNDVRTTEKYSIWDITDWQPVLFKGYISMNRFKEAVSNKIRLNLAFGQCKALWEHIQGTLGLYLRTVVTQKHLLTLSSLPQIYLRHWWRRSTLYVLRQAGCLNTFMRVVWGKRVIYPYGKKLHFLLVSRFLQLAKFSHVMPSAQYQNQKFEK